MRLQEEAHFDRDKYNQGDQYAQDQSLLPVADAEVQDLGEESAVVHSLQTNLCVMLQSCSKRMQQHEQHLSMLIWKPAAGMLGKLQGLQILTGCCLLSALIELGEGKSSSEKMLGLRFLASSIGSSSSCSSGAFSTNEGEVRVLKLTLCLSMLLIECYRRRLSLVQSMPYLRLRLGCCNEQPLRTLKCGTKPG